MFQRYFRNLAGLLSAFALLNTALGVVNPAWDANIWWIDLRWLGPPLAAAILTACSLAMLAGVLSNRHAAHRAAAASALLLCGLALFDAARYAALLGGGTLHAGLTVPLSLGTAACLAGIARSFAREAPPQPPIRRAVLAAAALATAAAFPIAQMAMFGGTDYRRPAAAILVFGARAYPDGRPSDALSDRVRAAARLYHQGLAPLVIMSGGPGDGAVHETEAMQLLAESLGVPRDRIVRDERGVNTRASIRNCSRFTAGPVLAVSHGYHLPRIKLEADRAGLALYTVPAPQGQPLRKLPIFVARETLAWWWYYARPA
jgi:uncharacterized SAM-binding protein YcdF (DUF218 family)